MKCVLRLNLELMEFVSEDAPMKLFTMAHMNLAKIVLMQDVCMV
uniref:Bm13388 n=1 Tax=Brugia malayi TaxID=6279 RepID=A0A0J9XNH1_BRUMA|nr:Bm13388 [Brugia malayi]